jgi:NADPH-dependent curcumin reductase CurA
MEISCAMFPPEGQIKYREDVVEGLNSAPRALIGLLRGQNFGKLLVRVAANDTRHQHKPI